jgi:ribosome biogenesis protein Nip4
MQEAVAKRCRYTGLLPGKGGEAMRLLKKFLIQVGSKYRPEELFNINNKRFTEPIDVKLKRDMMTYNGLYLGQNRRWFTPSSMLLQKLAKEDATKKAYVDRDVAWLFVVGKDIFEENVQRFHGDVKLGRYCLVMLGEGCIGYGRYETSGDLRVIKNMFDVGDFLRRE